jgi:hypothetical protein
MMGEPMRDVGDSEPPRLPAQPTPSAEARSGSVSVWGDRIAAARQQKLDTVRQRWVDGGHAQA